MAAYFTTLFRALIVAASLACVAPTADAAGPATASTAPARGAPVETVTDDGPPLDGLLILAGVVGLLIVVAWLGSRVGDNRSHVID